MVYNIEYNIIIWKVENICFFHSFYILRYVNRFALPKNILWFLIPRDGPGRCYVDILATKIILVSLT